MPFMRSPSTSAQRRAAHGAHARYVDLSAYLTFGPGDHQRINLSLENALDEDYATRLSRASRDVGGASYVVHARGVPRTLHATYSYSF